MGRGVGAGFGAGGVVAVLGLGLLSLSSPLPHPALGPVANAPAAPAPAAPEAAAPEAAAAMPSSTAPEGAPAAALEVPAGSEFARGGADTIPAAPAEVVEAPESAATPEQPAAQGETPLALPGTEPPARPEAGAEAPTAPEPPPTASAALETAPQAEAPVPVPPPGEAVAPDLPQAEAEAAPAAVPEAAAPSEGAAVQPAPAPEAVPEVAAAPEPAAPSEAPIAAAEPQPAESQPAAPQPAASEAPSEITLMPDGAVVPPKPDLPRVFVAGEGQGRFATAEGTTVNRLPQIGGQPQAPALPRLAAPAAPAETQKPGFKRPPGAEPAPEADLPRVITPEPAAPEAEAPVAPGSVTLAEDAALRRYAAAFTETPGLPLFSVVLIDVGTAAGGLDAETIKTLGPAVTVAIDPERPDAAAAMADYRAAGMEVAILADPLPKGATAQDVEVAFDAWHRALPEAVALVEPERPVLQVSSRLVNQAVKVLGAEGMAYVTQAIGIEGAAQIARNAGLPQASVWRVLDGRRDKAPVIERTLSRAAFEASRKGGVVVMLSAWPESVAGLSQWLAEAGGTVSAAPLSAMALHSAEN